MKKVILLTSVILSCYISHAQKSKPVAPAKSDSLKPGETVQFVIILDAGTLNGLQNFVNNPNYFTPEGGKAYWQNTIVPLIKPFRVPADTSAKK
jgi:hypothetical protein